MMKMYTTHSETLYQAFLYVPIPVKAVTTAVQYLSVLSFPLNYATNESYDLNIFK